MERPLALRGPAGMGLAAMGLAAVVLALVLALGRVAGPRPSGPGGPGGSDSRAGTVLRFAASDAPAPAGPRETEGALVVLEPERDLGRVDVGAAARVEFPWRRRGDGSLRVLALETGCACAVATGLPETIPAGAEGTLVVEVKARPYPGPFSHVLRVRTDRPPTDMIRLAVRGFVGTAVVVEPLAVDLGRVPPGRRLARTLVVRPPPGADVGAVEARLVDLDGACEVRPPARRGVRGADVLVAAASPDRPGPFQGHVEVRVRGEGRWRVPVRGEVVVADAAPGASEAPIDAGGG